MKALATLIAAGVLSSFAAGQTFTTVSFETFDYPFPSTLGGPGGTNNLNGGIGWANAWWSGGNGDDVVVQADPPTNPNNPFPWAGGDDGVGNYAQQAIEFGGGFRFPDAGAHPDITSNNMFGVDGSKLWFTFNTKRFLTQGVDNYAGFSLNEQGVAERLFVGSPWQANGWGIDDQVNGAVLATGGPTQDQGGTVVFSIEYQAGDEILHLWVNPTSAHPDPNVETPLIDSMIADHVWNEIRISSGGSVTLYYWDAIHIEKETAGSPVTVLCDPANNHTGGNYTKLDNSTLGAAGAGMSGLHLEATDGPVGEFGYFLVSNGATNSLAVSNGILCLDNPQGRYAPAAGTVLNSVGVFDAAGVYNSTVQAAQGWDVPDVLPAPPGGVIVAGDTWYFQMWYRDGQRSNFSNAISVNF